MGCSSKTGVQLTPLLFVFQTPPDAAPIQILLGLFTSTSMVVTRPLILEGPTFLGFQFLNTLLMSTFSTLSTGVATFFDFCAVASNEKTEDTAKMVAKRIMRMLILFIF